jgi:hypothetical protein
MVSGAFAKAAAGAFCVAALLLAARTADARVNVTTHHYDNLRSGWNPQETRLTPATLGTGKFGLLASVSVDDQVDAQPLIVERVKFRNLGIHDVVYVATESNSVYALDAYSGTVLMRVNLGIPVPQTMLPGRCGNDGPNVGINGTPVIDPTTMTMYVITYTLEESQPVYRLHALALATLADRAPPVVITAVGTLLDGETYQFTPAVSRQRAALLLSNGNVYAGFASFCDVKANMSRGWVLGWQEASLAPLSTAKVTNILSTSPHNFFLSSVWMSGNGLAADAAGDIYFVTGNSDRSGTTHDSANNPSESVIQLAPDLSAIESSFAPSNADTLDEHDEDFASGGVLLLPPQPGAPSNLAVAAGKFGKLYLLNADNLLNPNGPEQAYGVYPSGKCWCGESYFEGSDGVGRIVSSGGSKAGIWRVVTNPALQLKFERWLPDVANGQDPGFFTSVSSNEIQAGTAIVWAVGRPVDQNPAYVNLYAFDPISGVQLYSAVAGSWFNVGGNSNIVPVVANGYVYVATDQALAIFGLGARSRVELAKVTKFSERGSLSPGEHEIYATLQSIAPDRMNVQTRTGRAVAVDISDAERNHLMAKPALGHALLARGTFDQDGVMHANTILHAKDNPALWRPDR